MRSPFRFSRFLPAGFFLVVVTLISGWLWQSVDAHDGQSVKTSFELHTRAASGNISAAGSFTATIWLRDVITTQDGISFRSDAFRFDGADRPLLVYYGANSDGVYFARKDGATWKFEELDRNVDSTPSLAIDRINRPHVSYSKLDIAYHAQLDGDSWHITALDTGLLSATEPVIAASSEGTIGIAFSSYTGMTPTLHYAQLTGSDWVIETAITGTDQGEWGINWFSGALAFDYDAEGRPYIAYVNTIRGPRDSEHLAFAVKSGAAWSSRTLAGDMFVSGHILSLADTLGGYVAFSTYGPPCVIPCHRTSKLQVHRLYADGIIGAPVFGFDSDFNWVMGLAVHAGTPEILYGYSTDVGPFYDAKKTTKLWRYRISNTEPESNFVVADEITSAALALNSQGEPMIVYYAPIRKELVTVKRVQVQFAHGLYLPSVSDGE